MTKPTLSVLIPTFNRCHLLPRSLDSVLSQTLPPHQVIVINDGSTDDTKKVLKPYRDRIEYIQQDNGGKSSALNAASPRVSGEYVWIFDDDDVAIPDAWEHHASVLQRRPEVGFTYGSYYSAELGNDGKPVGPVEYHTPPEVTEEDLFLRLMEINFISDQTKFVRTSCYRKLGGWDTSLIRSQDYEMGLRLARTFRGVRVDHPVCYYRIHKGLRGSAAEQWTAAQNRRKWREYDQMIFKKLRAELKLHEYLPRSFTNGNLMGTDRRRAYLQRMVIMLARGLFDEASEDVMLVLGEKTTQQSLLQAEREILWRVATNECFQDVLNEEPASVRRIRNLCRSQIGSAIRQEIARGFYWNARRATRGKNLRIAYQSMAATFLVSGLRGVAGSAMSRYIWPRRSGLGSQSQAWAERRKRE